MSESLAIAVFVSDDDFVEALKDVFAKRGEGKHKFTIVEKPESLIDIVPSGQFQLLITDHFNTKNDQNLIRKLQNHCPIAILLDSYVETQVKKISKLDNCRYYFKNNDTIRDIIRIAERQYRQWKKNQELIDLQGKFADYMNRCRTALDSAGVGIACFSKEGGILNANEYFFRFSGIDEKDHDPSLLFNDYLDSSEQIQSVDLKKLMSEELKEINFEQKIHSKNGTTIWINHRISVVKNPQSDVDCFLAVLEDVTDEKITRKALLQSEQRYRMLVDNAFDAIFLVRGDRVEYANYSFSKITGYSFEELTSDNITVESIVPQNHLKQFRKEFYTFSQKSEKESPVILYIMNSSGSEIALEVSRVMLGEMEDKTILGVGRDITERLRMENNEKLKSSLSASLSGINDMDDAMSLCLETALEASGFDSGGFYIVNDNNMLHLSAHSGLNAKFVKMVKQYAEDSYHYKIVKKAKPIYISKAELAKSPFSPLQYEKFTALAILPIKSNGNPIACLNISSHKHTAVPDGVKLALEAVTAQIGDAIVRLKTENELRKIQARYELIVENANEVILVVQDNRINHANKKASILFDIKPGAAFDYFLEFVHKDDRKVMRYLYNRSVNNLEKYNDFTFRCFSVDKSSCWMEMRASNITWDQEPAALISFVDVTEKKNTEIALRESERRHRMVIENQGEGIIVADLEENIVICNPAAEKILGVEPASLEGRNLKEFLSAENFNAIKEQTQEKLSGAKATYEIEIIRSDKTSRTLRTSTHPWLDDNGKVIGSFGIFRDITEEKNADEAIKASEMMLLSVLDNIPVGVFWKDKDSKYLGCNSLFAKVAGYNKPDDVKGKTDKDMRWKEKAEHFIAIDKKIMKNVKQIITYEETIKMSDGIARVLSITKTPLTKPNGDIIGVLGTYEDITEGRKALEELEIQKAFLEELFEGAPEAIAVLDNDDVVLRVNREFTRMYGYSLEEARGNLINDLIVPDDLKDEGRWATNKVTTGQMLNMETVRQRKDKTQISVSILGKPVKLGENQLGIYGIYRDITKGKEAEEEKLQLEEQLRQSQKMESIGRLAGGVAHDFNNLLSVIILHSELMMTKIARDDQLYDEIKLIMKTGERAADLTGQLLAFGRKQMLQVKVMNLNDEIRQIQKMLERIIPEDIEINAKLSSNVGNIRADPAQLNQIIVNLAVNAKDAMPDGGELVIETMNMEFDKKFTQFHAEIKPGRYVMMAISDSGSGMDAETIEHIFEPFFTTKEMGKGTGLGLSTVYGIVKQHGGTANVYSEPGYGTTFKIYFPRVDEVIEDSTLNIPSEKSENGSETVLVVEDEDSVRMLIRDILNEYGYNLLVAGSPEEALNIVKQYDSEIDLLLSDIIMPKMNGKELYLQLSPMYPKMKGLFISGYTENVIANQDVIIPGTLFLQKPFSVTNLTNKVRQALES